jgi:hypothetical protein
MDCWLTYVSLTIIEANGRCERQAALQMLKRATTETGSEQRRETSFRRDLRVPARRRCLQALPRHEEHYELVKYPIRPIGHRHRARSNG